MMVERLGFAASFFCKLVGDFIEKEKNNTFWPVGYR